MAEEIEMDANQADKTPPPKKTVNNKRQHERYGISMPVMLRISNGELIKARAVDISLGGLYIEDAAAAETGRTFDMLFDLPFTGQFERVYVRATVMRCVIIGNRDLFGIALQFTEFARDTQAVLERYIEHREQKRNDQF